MKIMVRLGSPLRKFIFPIILLILVIVVLGWFLTPSNLPGEGVTILGREHIADSLPDPVYNSNPPTSGPHSPVWVRAGFYESGRNDRNLVHSLEHGYVVVSYNCSIRETSYKKKFSIDDEVWAHGEEASTESGSRGINGESGKETTESAVTVDESCHELQDYLKDLVKKFGEWKIVAVPRSKNDTRLALTAWGRIDKFNSLDKERIEKFIKAFRDKGPEATKD